MGRPTNAALDQRATLARLLGASAQEASAAAVAAVLSLVERGYTLDELASFPARNEDYTGAILGWSETRTALHAMACDLCERAITEGQAYRAADTIGNVGGVYAHDACTE